MSPKRKPTRTPPAAKTVTYRDAGVDIDAGEALVDAIKPLAKATRRKGADASLGGFGALFDLRAAGFRDPILVASTDGVGTKLKVAIDTGLHKTVGIDLVAMCVNDIVVQGAEPLFFLDYFATGKLDVRAGRDIVAGIAEGCAQANCALIGGETAEMPGMYAKGDYDLAGFTVGAAERGKLLDGTRTVKPGDVLLGLASTGVHSNGFSLVRRLVEKSGVAYTKPAPFEPRTKLGAALLRPTRIYVKGVMPAVKKGLIKAMAHITGGGLIENIPRVLPNGMVAELDATTWPLLPVFKWLKQQGNIDSIELARTFNCGLGMVIAVDPRKAAQAIAALKAGGETVYRVGRVVAGKRNAEPSTRLLNADKAWTDKARAGKPARA